MSTRDQSTRKPKPGLLQMTFSIIAAFCGIQSNRNHDIDDSHIEQVGFIPYIIVGVVMTIVFVLLVYGVVRLILGAAS